MWSWRCPQRTVRHRSELLGTSISLVSLVGENEQTYAGQFGLNIDRTAKEVSFCAQAIMTSKPFVIENADNDPRFSLNPLVACEQGIKSYVGIPLETSPGILPKTDRRIVRRRQETAQL